ncbi:BrnA antitoxin family protein [Microbaculum marinum]|uniref:BrnA antitoxin family protein n=1 Tax=Microbaculum marinum TaxID=1764581 RepID=UPI00361F0C1C
MASPELTDEQLAGLRPAREVFPDLDFPRPRTRGPQKAPTKVQTTLRLDQDVVEHFRAGGRGWQTRLNDALRRVVEAEQKKRA